MTKLSKEIAEGTIDQVGQIFQCVSHEDLKKEFILVVEELEGKAKSTLEAELLAEKFARQTKEIKEERAKKVKSEKAKKPKKKED